MARPQEIGPDIWTVEGPVVTAALGFAYPTRMVAIRLADGGLFLWSPVALSPELAADLAALGQVRHLVAPNGLHDSFIGDWVRAHPRALAHAAPGLRLRRPDIGFGSDLGPAPHPDWAESIDQAVVGGNRITTEVVFFHRPSGTALVTDLLQQLPPEANPGWRALVARADGMTGPAPSVPRKFRLAFTDRATARRAIRKVLDWPVRQLVIAHGPAVTPDGGRVLRRAFRWLGVEGP